MRVICVLAEQVSGQKVIFMDKGSGAICKTCHGMELQWYQRCQSDQNLSAFLAVLPEVIEKFRLRFGVDKIDLTDIGVSEGEMSQFMEEVKVRLEEEEKAVVPLLQKELKTK